VKRTCYFHAGCPDGFGAAWAVWRAWGRDVRFVARGHEDPFDPRPHEGELVVFVDIAPPPESPGRALEPRRAGSSSLDHHVSARDRFAACGGLDAEHARRGHRIHFDLDHSGAVLAWQHFHPGGPPELLRYVEDQDLWSWKLPSSEEVNATIGSYPRFATWEPLAARPSPSCRARACRSCARNRVEVGALRSRHPAPVAIGQRVEAVNARYLRAQIGHALAERATFGPPWGVVYRITADRVDVSLYSIGELDVAAVAARYGGGGHRNAAGFTVVR
jgi:hypothetical protein